MVEIAEIFSRLSTCSARASVGALLFDDNFAVVATGYNGSPQGAPHCNDVGCVLDAGGSCTRSVHAEVNAILQCAYYGISARGLNMYCTHSPCVRCAAVIVRAGIARVLYGNEYKGSEEAQNIMRSGGVYVVKYIPGVLQKFG